MHDRQPVFLTTKEALDRWLDTSPQTWAPELTKMVQPYRHEKTPLEWYVLPQLDVRPSERPPFSYQVPKEVGRVGTESPSFIEPITSRKDGIQALFSKQRQKSLQPTSSPATLKAKRNFEDNPTPSGLPAESSATVDTNPSVSVGPSPSKRPKKLAGDESNQPESVSISFPVSNLLHGFA